MFFTVKMEASSTRFTNPKIPQYNGNNYDYCDIIIKVLFSSKNIWEYF